LVSTPFARCRGLTINEDEPLGFQFGLTFKPGLPASQDVGALLL
jgi:hypothetical protein